MSDLTPLVRTPLVRWGTWTRPAGSAWSGLRQVSGGEPARIRRRADRYAVLPVHRLWPAPARQTASGQCGLADRICENKAGLDAGRVAVQCLSCDERERLTLSRLNGGLQMRRSCHAGQHMIEAVGCKMDARLIRLEVIP